MPRAQPLDELTQVVQDLIVLQARASGTQPDPEMRQLMEQTAPAVLASEFRGRATKGSTGFGSRAFVPWFGFDRRDSGLWLVFLFPADRASVCLTLMIDGETYAGDDDAISLAASQARDDLGIESCQLRLGANTRRIGNYESGVISHVELSSSELDSAVFAESIERYLQLLDELADGSEPRNDEESNTEVDELATIEDEDSPATEGATESSTHVNIRPGVSAINAYRYMDTNEWYALGEFVDNSISSWLSNQARLTDPATGKAPLKIAIRFDNVDGGRIRVWDNAAGIDTKDFQRAFRPGDRPDDQDTLSRYGLGMKMASIWFADNWKVTTTAYNEDITRIIEFDVPKIIAANQEIVVPREIPRRGNGHGTEIVLWNLRKVPVGATLGKMKRHIAEMYRGFIRTGNVEIFWNGEPLEYTHPTVLHAPYYEDGPTGDVKVWKKKFTIEVPGSSTISGRAVLFDKGKQSEAGLNLFWRGRLIKGNLEPNYKPSAIFFPGSFRLQRLQVELDLDDFTPTLDKKDFAWNACPLSEDELLSKLKEALNEGDLPMLTQADEYRAKELDPTAKGHANAAAANVREVIEKKAGHVIERIIDSEEVGEDVLPEPARKNYAHTENLLLNVAGRKWRVLIQLSDKPEDRSEWVDITDRPAGASTDDVRRLGIRVSLANPFTVRFGTSRAAMDILIRMAAGVAIAEITAREAGDKSPGAVRRNLNDLLLNVLSET